MNIGTKMLSGYYEISIDHDLLCVLMLVCACLLWHVNRNNWLNYILQHRRRRKIEDEKEIPIWSATVVRFIALKIT